MRYEVPDHVAEAAIAKAGGTRPIPLADALVALIGADEQVCASETCDRPFLLQTDRPSNQHRTKGLLYCSNLCARAQAQREYRRRQRTA